MLGRFQALKSTGTGTLITTAPYFRCPAQRAADSTVYRMNSSAEGTAASLSSVLSSRPRHRPFHRRPDPSVTQGFTCRSGENVKAQPCGAELRDRVNS